MLSEARFGERNCRSKGKIWPFFGGKDFHFNQLPWSDPGSRGSVARDGIELLAVVDAISPGALPEQSGL